MIKDKTAKFLNDLMKELGETQEGLAKRLGITKSSLQGYLKGVNLPNIEVLLRMVELGGTDLNDFVKSETPKLHIENSHGFAFAARDAYINTKIYRKTEYKPGPDDITGEQANKLKELVNEIVTLEQKTKKKPKTYGAVWNALNRKMGVTYYREIKQNQFELAILYLMQWKGRLNKGLKRTDADEWRKKTQAAIFAAARNQLRWTKDALDNYIYERFKKESIRDLTKKELTSLYNAIFSRKNK